MMKRFPLLQIERKSMQIVFLVYLSGGLICRFYLYFK